MFHLCEKFVLKLVGWELGAQIRGLLCRSKELKFVSGFFFSKSVPLEPYSPRNKYYPYFINPHKTSTFSSVRAFSISFIGLYSRMLHSLSSEEEDYLFSFQNKGVFSWYVYAYAGKK